SNPSHSATASASYTVQPDLTAPTAPSGLVATVKRRQVSLSWQAASDNVRVAGYRVLRNGVVIATTTALGWVDATVGSSIYTYSVSAYDNAGNLSLPSNSVTVNLATSGKGK